MVNNYAYIIKNLEENNEQKNNLNYVQSVLNNSPYILLKIPIIGTEQNKN